MSLDAAPFASSVALVVCFYALAPATRALNRNSIRKQPTLRSMQQLQLLLGLIAFLLCRARQLAYNSDDCRLLALLTLICGIVRDGLDLVLTICVQRIKQALKHAIVQHTLERWTLWIKSLDRLLCRNNHGFRHFRHAFVDTRLYERNHLLYASLHTSSVGKKRGDFILWHLH